MRKSWWKIPLYCIVASWICFQLEVRFLVRWTIVTLPDGSISTDSTRRLILNIVLFIIVVAIGGFFFFRKMTHKELFCSASVLVVLNIVFGLIAYKMQGMFSFSRTHRTMLPDGRLRKIPLLLLCSDQCDILPHAPADVQRSRQAGGVPSDSELPEQQEYNLW